MSATTQLTLKRVAALREMADLGCTTMAACSLLDLDYGSIYYLNDKYRFNLRACKLGRPGNHFPASERRQVAASARKVLTVLSMCGVIG
jgi:hypothetical protein